MDEAQLTRAGTVPTAQSDGAQLEEELVAAMTSEVYRGSEQMETSDGLMTPNSEPRELLQLPKAKASLLRRFSETALHLSFIKSAAPDQSATTVRQDDLRAKPRAQALVGLGLPRMLSPDSAKESRTPGKRPSSRRAMTDLRRAKSFDVASALSPLVVAAPLNKHEILPDDVLHHLAQSPPPKPVLGLPVPADKDAPGKKQARKSMFRASSLFSSWGSRASKSATTSPMPSPSAVEPPSMTSSPGPCNHPSFEDARLGSPAPQSPSTVGTHRLPPLEEGLGRLSISSKLPFDGAATTTTVPIAIKRNQSEEGLEWTQSPHPNALIYSDSSARTSSDVAPSARFSRESGYATMDSSSGPLDSSPMQKRRNISLPYRKRSSTLGSVMTSVDDGESEDDKDEEDEPDYPQERPDARQQSRTDSHEANYPSEADIRQAGVLSFDLPAKPRSYRGSMYAVSPSRRSSGALQDSPSLGQNMLDAFAKKSKSALDLTMRRQISGGSSGSGRARDVQVNPWSASRPPAARSESATRKSAASLTFGRPPSYAPPVDREEVVTSSLDVRPRSASGSFTARSASLNAAQKLQIPQGVDTRRVSVPVLSQLSSASSSSESFKTRIGRSASASLGSPTKRGSPAKVDVTPVDSASTYFSRVVSLVHPSRVLCVLSEKHDAIRQSALRVYLSGFDFYQDAFDIALRKVLLVAVLPTETQQIDRVMEAFASHYCDCNPNVFQTSEQAYVIAFSLIMLHTDHWNPNNKRKMSKTEYLRNTSIDGVPDVFLEYLYENTTYTPFRYVDDADPRHLDEKGDTSPLSPFSSPPLSKPRLDLYGLMARDQLHALHVDLGSTISPHHSLSCTGTVPFLNTTTLNQHFAAAPTLLFSKSGQIRRSIPMDRISAASSNNELLTTAPPRHTLSLPVVRAGFLTRKCDYVDTDKRSGNRKWRQIGAVLTSSQLLIFKDTASLYDVLDDLEGRGATGQRPTADGFIHQPDEIWTLKDAVAVYDPDYIRREHVFRLRHGTRQDLFQTDDYAALNDWLACLNYAAAFRTSDLSVSDNPAAARQALSDPEADDSEASPVSSKLFVSHSDRRDRLQKCLAELSTAIADDQKRIADSLASARRLAVLMPLSPALRVRITNSAQPIAASLARDRIALCQHVTHQDILSRHSTTLSQTKQRRIGSPTEADLLEDPRSPYRGSHAHSEEVLTKRSRPRGKRAQTFIGSR
ncbi:uncharacterized protein L969DRAFT_78852 [Mixia osmundae IAM 14324]|uniref:SEC7 domain-containing protein n=1 Tax=Mixia osmundae (strain CBS 9802 / IAM 14324 / JCM 22182 / KY 12970) TaxID=764103 RepID=G7DSX3_MIXOS|nr:uncharacterized protein L969DRAFT_78852 [Mixia osmundae IAM 14324]KEI37097.1 hypothetical protein L969DRAFT_78852 [Mixia osmundae IAM 14324]GAA93683.1 hypothetical protein E5Q_00328 [Mixia osmundae IAM 14324]